MHYNIIFITFTILLQKVHNHNAHNHKSLGCFEEYLDSKIKMFPGNKTSTDCVHLCIDAYFKYAFLHLTGECLCGNAIGRHYSDESCNISCVNCISQSKLVDAFKAAIVPGPCKNVIITKITDTTARLTWDAPPSFEPIKYYKIEGTVIKTFADHKLNQFNLRYDDNTVVDLPSLNPGTEYNLTLYAVNNEGVGEKVYHTFTTQIGDPDHEPLPPKILYENDTIAKMHISPVTNNNGPISKYLVIVKNMNSVQTFDPEYLKSYDDAKRDGTSYYIAAELEPSEIYQPFTVGDEQRRQNYYNAKLETGVRHEIIIGIKSVGNSLTKFRFSNNSNLISIPFMINNFDSSQEPTSLDIIFYIAITIMVILIIVVIIAFVILKRKISQRTRRQLSDNQELTLQGPMIDMENNGYIHDDDTPINHKETLNSQVWNIPRRLLDKERGTHLGQGRFGFVQSGTVEVDNMTQTASIYSIIDERLNCEEKRCMLKDLDTLIKAGKHQNVMELVGICEDLDTVNVVLHYATTNLKDMLLNSRNGNQGRISTIREVTLIDYSLQICKGMAHLESKHIIHKQLCARNVVFVNGVPKVSGLGLAQYTKDNLTPIYTRWTAKEIFRGQSHVSKSDVWSFACLLWEICAIGATPYDNTPNSEIPDKILRGMRLQQMQHVDDNLYQILLNCWQLDLDERPTFVDLTDALQNLIEDGFEPYLNLEMYPNFHYEPYYSELELIPKNM